MKKKITFFATLAMVFASIVCVTSSCSKMSEGRDLFKGLWLCTHVSVSVGDEPMSDARKLARQTGYISFSKGKINFLDDDKNSIGSFSYDFKVKESEILETISEYQGVITIYNCPLKGGECELTLAGMGHFFTWYDEVEGIEISGRK